MSKIIVLGAGMVGSAMAIDLAKTHEVTITDLSQKVLDTVKGRANSLKTQVLDVTQTDTLKEEISDFDLVICAVPGFLGYQTLKVIIEAKKDVVDISFFPEDALELDKLAKENEDQESPEEVPTDNSDGSHCRITAGGKFSRVKPITDSSQAQVNSAEACLKSINQKHNFENIFDSFSGQMTGKAFALAKNHI